MRTFDFFGRFIGFGRLTPGAPLYHRGQIDEAEEPYRSSTAHVLRLWPLRRAVVVGRWHACGSAADRFNELLGLREIDWKDEHGGLDRKFAADVARTHIAKSAKDPNLEWRLLSKLGLDE